MKHVLRRLIRFRIGQKASRAAVRSVGLKTLAGVIGVLGGVHYMRKH